MSSTNTNTYIITGKTLDKLDIVGYTLESSNGEKKIATIDKVVKLINNKRITNASVCLDKDGGEFIVIVDNGLDSINTVYLNSESPLELQAKIIEDGKCIGYKVRDITGKMYTISINDAWSIAVNHGIKGVRACFNGKTKKLLSENNMLKSLPRINN